MAPIWQDMIRLHPLLSAADMLFAPLPVCFPANSSLPVPVMEVPARSSAEAEYYKNSTVCSEWSPGDQMMNEFRARLNLLTVALISDTPDMDPCHVEGDVVDRVHHNLLVVVTTILKRMLAAEVAEIQDKLPGFPTLHITVRSEASKGTKDPVTGKTHLSRFDHCICLETDASTMADMHTLSWTKPDSFRDAMLKAMEWWHLKKSTEPANRFPGCPIMVLAIVEEKRPGSIQSVGWDFIRTNDQIPETLYVQEIENAERILCQARQYAGTFNAEPVLAIDNVNAALCWVRDPGKTRQKNSVTGNVGILNLEKGGITGPRFVLALVCFIQLQRGLFNWRPSLEQRIQRMMSHRRTHATG